MSKIIPTFRQQVRAVEKLVKLETDDQVLQIDFISQAQGQAAKFNDERSIDILAIAKRRIIRKQVANV